MLLLIPMLVLVFSKYWLLSVAAPVDFDYWWHVKTGQYISETGMLPRQDSYSHTVNGRHWVTHEWLTEVVLYRVQQQFGYAGNVALFGTITTLAALAVYATCRVRGVGEVGATILMIWAAVMSLMVANVRAQALTGLFVALWMLLLTRYKQGHRRAIWPLPPLLALWVNLHGGYIIGLALLGMTIVGETLARVLRRPAAPLRPLLLVTALSTCAALITPHGIEALTYPFSYLGSAAAPMKYIAEWQSPDFHQAHALAFAASLVLAVLLGLARRPLGPTEVLWAVALALMALQSQRHIALYAIVVIPLLGARLQADVPFVRLPLSAWRRPALVAISWPLLVLVVLTSVSSAAQQGHPPLSRELKTTAYPAGAAAYLREHQLRGNLFNPYHWGGFLIYQLYPERTVFVDGRTDVYDQFLGRYRDVVELRPNWRRILDEHDVTLMLVEKEGPLAVALSGDADWQEVYAGDVERLFARR